MEPSARPLSDTDRGLAWVKNFPAQEQESAERLLLGIEIISETRFRNDLRLKLVEFRKNVEQESIGAFAIQGLPTGDLRKCYYKERSDLGDEQGSGLIIENIIRRTGLGVNAQFYPSVQEMKKAKLDVLLFVTDTIGSGREATEMIKFFTDNPTIRSWISSGHMRMELITHSISDEALTSLQRLKGLHRVHYVSPTLSFDTSGWTETEREDIESLCQSYADKPRFATGFGGTANLTIYQHTVTNGLPRILLQKKRKGGGQWASLLPGIRDHGMAPDDERVTSGYTPVWSSPEAINSLQAGAKRRLQQQERAAIMTSSGHPFEAVVILLVCIRAGITPEWRQLRFTRMTQSRWAEILRYAIQLGYITPQQRITTAGHAVVTKFGKVKLREAEEVVNPPEQLYYPQSLR